MNRVAVLLLALVASVAAVGRCGFQQHFENELKRNPNARVAQALTSTVPDDLRKISVRVKIHVLYNTPQQNISEEQIRSQFAVLNKDYSATNTDKSYASQMFQPLIGTPNIEFVMDPVINRKQVSQQSWYNNYNIQPESGVPPVDPDSTINVWIVNLGGPKGPDDTEVLGYGCAPPCDPTRDGVVMSYKAFGTIGTVVAPYNLGRTLTHEMGHYFGLWHPFGGEEVYGCDHSEDFVEDTPTTNGPSYGCYDTKRPVQACGHAINVENFMDYGDDRCITMFTIGQVTRLRQTLLQHRPGLIDSGSVIATPPPTPPTTEPPTPRPKGKNNPTPKPKKKKTPKPTPQKKKGVVRNVAAKESGENISFAAGSF